MNGDPLPSHLRGKGLRAWFLVNQDALRIQHASGDHAEVSGLEIMQAGGGHDAAALIEQRALGLLRAWNKL